MLEDDIFLITEVNISDSGLQSVAGALADHGGAGGTPGGQRGWLRSWVTGWTHRLDVDPLGLPQPEPIAGVGRLAEAVVDVLLERRPLEQMRRWLSRDVAGQLMPPQPPGRAIGAQGSGVVIQDGPRVRAVALRFEQSAPVTPGRHGTARPGGFDWLCTALQFN